MRKLKELFQFMPGICDEKRSEKELNHLVYDSRKAEKNDVFVALKGSKTDSHQYIPDLLKKGVYIVAENGLALPHENIFFVEDTRKALALLSKAYFHHPDKDLFIVGITGTNGKTTTTYMIRSILAVMGIKTGIIGTIQYLIGDESIKAENTTPESYEIFKMFHEMKEKGCKAVAMEISSHALSMSRVYGIDLDMAVFTNLTQDHLDYHKTFEEYLKAKLQIFTLLSKSSKEKKMALINRDIPEFEELKKSLSINHLPYQTYGIHYPADWQGISSSMNIYHNLFHILYEKKDYSIDTPMLGFFNIYNALTAAAAAVFFGADPNSVEAGLKEVEVKGRFERVENSLGFGVIIDYAHTPDALENVLKTAQALNPINIITVFGAGGDRDKGKRPLMGKAALKYSSFVILTSDNPRSEDPLSIIQDIEKAFDNKELYSVFIDREKAVEKAIDMAEEGDLVIIAGKGHEEYQIFKDETVHFSDRESALRYIRLKEEKKKKNKFLLY
ncbi:MAG TPA: UDP-N-acetylmuramoyl-L-alanyl-D-glutamate--2,6-diaminopimelate ligase [Spirochaetia bacterium]|nr:MAG: UDP-N-acetylmuramoyl-L-alanyl-D-glutamate--2,6-diaminopimelate ligase [Spirochaetes bacterium GWB1_36_13]HCL56090.1 UDP-N-acetylmuramoyl-L-alanyl-D-glutamate--2,6-diaminopimelate ligase [Spirochaetia bacterium]